MIVFKSSICLAIESQERNTGKTKEAFAVIGYKMRCAVEKSSEQFIMNLDWGYVQHGGKSEIHLWVAQVQLHIYIKRTMLIITKRRLCLKWLSFLKLFYIEIIIFFQLFYIYVCMLYVVRYQIIVTQKYNIYIQMYFAKF